MKVVLDLKPEEIIRISDMFPSASSLTGRALIAKARDNFKAYATQEMTSEELLKAYLIKINIENGFKLNAEQLSYLNKSISSTVDVTIDKI